MTATVSPSTIRWESMHTQLRLLLGTSVAELPLPTRTSRRTLAKKRGDPSIDRHPMRVFERDRFRCQIRLECDGVRVNADLPASHPNKAHIDHMTPLGRGGVHEWDNVQTACRRCNLSKGHLTMAEVRAIRAQRDTVAPSMFYGYAKAAWASRLKLHKSSGRAYVNHKGRRVYFGTANTPESRERFARFCDNPAAYLEEQAARYTHVPITRALAAVRKLLRGIERTLNTETEGGGS